MENIKVHWHRVGKEKSNACGDDRGIGALLKGFLKEPERRRCTDCQRIYETTLETDGFSRMRADERPKFPGPTMPHCESLTSMIEEVKQRWKKRDDGSS